MEGFPFIRRFHFKGSQTNIARKVRENESTAPSLELTADR
jgi:hypothetical protein